MAFAFSDRHIDEYRTQGYTVFRQILPPSLIGDLRRVCDEARDLARQQHGSQAQRLQPIADFPLDQQPFVDYAELPVLIDAIHRLLSPDFRIGGAPVMGVLFEPAEWPWCTHWHRDWRDNIPGLELARWDEHFRRRPLLQPGQLRPVRRLLHLGRPRQPPAPRPAMRSSAFPGAPHRQRPTSKDCPLRSASTRCREYARSMPGARQLFLDAGDFCLYRNTLWHLGSYVPYAKRATLHDAVDTDEFAAWRDETLRLIKERQAAGHGMENPHRG